MEPEELTYGDKRQSIVNSSFDATKATKIIAHGFKGSTKHKAALNYVAAFLKVVSKAQLVVTAADYLIQTTCVQILG